MLTRKRTILSVFAVAVVAILGIASVSFAQWNNDRQLKAFAADLGEIELIGFTNDTAISVGNQKLVPFDQEGTLPANCVKVLTVELPEFEATANYQITVTFSDDSENTGLRFYTAVGTTQPELGTTIDTTKWTALGSPMKVNGITSRTPVSGMKLFIILDSSDNTDMNKSVKFDVTLALQ